MDSSKHMTNCDQFDFDLLFWLLQALSSVYDKIDVGIMSDSPMLKLRISQDRVELATIQSGRRKAAR